MHTLVVGGTGMLAGVTKWLAEQGHVVSIVSRTPSHVFSEVSDRKLNHIAVNYQNSGMLRERIAEAISIHGPIQLAVFWIHTDAPDAFAVIAEEIADKAEVPWRLYHVRGSAAHLHPQLPEVPPNCLYRQVILGFVIEGRESRWLTHYEISSGLIEAIHSNSEHSIVGTLEPWDKRPI